jgi:DNA-binding NarL/FixJ family response regulator
MAYRAGDLSNAVDLANDALEAARALGEDSTAARALYTLGAVMTFRKPAAARELLREGERCARTAGDEPTLIDLLQMVAFTYAFQEDHRLAASVLDEVAPLVDHSGAERAVVQRSLRAMGMMRRGRYVEAKAIIEPAIEIAAELGDLFALAFVLTWASQAAAGCGRSLEYDAMLRQTLHEATESGAHLAVAIAATSLALQEVSAGRPEAARLVLDEHRFGESEGLVAAFMYELVGAAASLAMADWPTARRQAQVAIDYGRAIESVYDVAFGTLIDAMALRFSGDPNGAESSAYEVVQLAVEAEFTPIVVTALDLIAGIALERESYIEAVRIFSATAAIRDRAAILVSDFEAVMRGADLDAARSAVGDAAYATAWDEGGRLDARETLEYVTRARGERKRPSAGWDSLTPRELAVVQLAAQGLTNPEIAEKLFVGRGTVKSHLANVFTKLGVRTRAELAAAAARRDV